jgi:2-C-methyl-D-erythritol 2,4-cyclodiphosphate synthase
MSIRIGFGVDFHQLVAGRDVRIGGVKIPFHLGAKGHSDADVLLHAIRCHARHSCIGDIGVHFPDTNAAFKNIDSKILLERSRELIAEKRI